VAYGSKRGGLEFHRAVIDAVAIAPVNGGGTNFRKTDFFATVEHIAREHYPETARERGTDAGAGDRRDVT
jgi:hypothetical protein